MKRKCRKLISAVLTLAFVCTSTMLCPVGIHAEAAALEEMIGNAGYNVALNKAISVYPSTNGRDAAVLVDGALGAEDAGSGFVEVTASGYNYYDESYVTIDLGDTYDASTIDQVVVQYRYGTVNQTIASVVGKAYSVQYSSDGGTFTTVASTESAVLDSERMTIDDVSSATGAVRYVRIYYPVTSQYGMQLLEIAVLDTDGNLAVISGAEIADVGNLTVTATADNTIAVQFDASTTEGVRYAIYVDNEMKMDNAVAGEANTITDLSVGTHTVVVKAIDTQGIASKGISRTVKVTGPVSAEEAVNNADYNLALNAAVDSDNWRGEGSSTYITNGNIGAKTETGDYGAVNTPGYLQITLAKAYKTSVIDEIDIWYRSSNPGLMPINTGYEIQLSDNGQDFVTIQSVAAENMPEQPADQNDIYTTKDDMKALNASSMIDTVKYIRIVYSGSISWGAQIREVAVLDLSGNAGELIEATTYRVSIDDTVVATVKEGDTYKIDGNAAYGYYDKTNGVAYHKDTEITVNSDIALTSITQLEIGVAKGAGIRVDGTSGIRFQATVQSDNTEALINQNVVKEGMLITTKDLYDNYGALSLECGYMMKDIPNEGWYNSETGIYCGSIVNIDAENYTRNFIARAYVFILYSDATTSVPIYSVHTETRNIKQVAEAVAAAGYPNLTESQKEMVNLYKAAK